MPPVANDFWDSVENLLDESTNGIGSRRALAARLHELDQRQTQDNWLRSLKRYGAGSVPNEETASLIAQAFGVPRDILPAAERLSLKSLDLRIRVAEAKAAVLETFVLDRLRELSAQVDAAATKVEVRKATETLREAIDAAASQGTRRSSPPKKEAKG